MIIKDLKQCSLKNAVRQQSFPCSHTMGPFDIIEKVHDIAYYHIDMSDLLGIHPVILEYVPKNEWNRQMEDAEYELDEVPFDVDCILENKFRRISRDDTRKIWC